MGAKKWSDGDIDDLVFEAVGGTKPERIVLAANQAANDREFDGWLGTVIRNALNERARSTPAGRVLRSMDQALRADPEQFVSQLGRWRLFRDERESGWSEGTQALIETAWTVKTAALRISAETEKTPPFAHSGDIRSVCAAVLERSGPLPKVLLGEVLAHRFNVAFEQRFGYLDLNSDEGSVAVSVATEPDAIDDVDDEMAAQSMLEQLTLDERSLLALRIANPSIRDLAAAVGCTKHKADVLTSRMNEKLRRLAIAAGDDGRGAMARLLELVGQQADLGHSSDQDGHLDDD